MIIRRRSLFAGGRPQKNTRPTGRPYNAALPRQIHPIYHKFRLCTGFTRDALTGRPLRYRIEAMKMNAGRCSQVAVRKKIHGLRPFRRGFHAGSPLERFRHSLAEYDDGSLRTTSYGLFSDSDAASPRQIHPICHKFRLCTGFTRDALTGRPLRYRIQAMKMNAGRCSQVADRKKTRPAAVS